MTLLIALLAIPLVFLLPGYLTARALLSRVGLSDGEKVFVTVATGVLVATWFAHLLAELGWYSPAALIALVLIYSIGVWLLHRSLREPSFSIAVQLLNVSLRGRSFGPKQSQLNVEKRSGDFNPTVSIRKALRLLRYARNDKRRPDWIFLAILALGAALAARPAEYILGGYDAGTYVNIGIAIARQGGIALRDALVQSLAYDPSRQFFLDQTNPYMLYKQVRLPGFFVADAASGLVLPQFLHFYPAWLAIFDSLLGVRGGLYATPLIGLLGSVAAYFVARTLFGRNVARLAFFLLVIDVPQFWFARYPVAEAMTQFLLLTGLYALLRSRPLSLGRAGGAEGIGLPLLAGAALGAIFLTRADSILLLAPLGLYALAVVFGRLWRREHWAFFIALGVVLVQAGIHMWVFAPQYFYFQYTHFLRMKNLDKLLPGGLPEAQEFLSSPLSLLPLAAAALAGLLVLFVLDRVVQVGRKRRGEAVSAAWRRAQSPARYLGAAALGVLFVFAYFVWPQPASVFTYIGGDTTLGRAGNLIKLGWYLSPVGLALALLGGLVVLLRDLNRHNAFLYGTGALFSFFYLEELYSNPHYIYTTRHYIPLVIPLFVLLATRGLAFLWRERSRPRRAPVARVLAGGGLALWLLYNLYAMGLVDASRAAGVTLRLPFVSETRGSAPLRVEPLANSIAGFTELGGAVDQVEALARMLPPNAVIIFSNNRDEPTKLATPLRYLYDRDALVARFNQPSGDKIAALIDTWRAQGREVILAYGTNGGKLALPGYTLEPVGRFALNVPQWAFSYQYMPRGFWPLNLNYTLYRAAPRTTAPPDPRRIDFGGDDYPSLVSGFLERPTGETTRWIGALPDLEEPGKPVSAVSGTLRLPDWGVGDTLYLVLVARAPQDGTRVRLRSGEASLGQVKMTTQFAAYSFALPRARLNRDRDSALLELVAPAFKDAQGRWLGIELQEATVSSRPIAPY